MELSKEKWTNKDIQEFQDYIKTLEIANKKEWTEKIINTQLPVLAIKAPTIKNIAKKISKGNFLSFLDYMPWEYYENTAINGFLINLIKDFNTMKYYLDIYSQKADNWATCDLLSFNVENKEEQFFNLAQRYIKDKKPFVRRIGLDILFLLIDKEKYLFEIFRILNMKKNEKQYYVNMVSAWLLCECFIKHKEETLLFFQKNTTNKFIINKAIQKCRESRRVSTEDKKMLLMFKRKD